MHWNFRNLFPYLALALVVGALAWATSFRKLPPADFTFINGTEIQSVDPAKVTGQPEGRIINGIFEGLYIPLPDPSEPTIVRPQPGLAESCELSDDGKTYTFRMRQSARWTDGTPITAHDVAWSWRRFLHPETASEYAYQLHYVTGAKKFNAGRVQPGDRVEVELGDRPVPDQMFPGGTIARGMLKQVQGETTDEKTTDEKTVYVVEVKPVKDGNVDWRAQGELRRFRKSTSGNAATGSEPQGIEHCRHVLPDFYSQVGIRAEDERTLVVTLENATPYFLHLVAFYPLFPVNRRCVETHGSPRWTRPENIVTSGPYRLVFRRIRDRIRLVKNTHYWNAAEVQLQTIDALAVNAQTTWLNMYMNGQVDWITNIPNTMITELRKRDDFISAPMLTTYFYRINVTRPPLDDPRVRRALNLAMDKRQICESVTRGGQLPARGFVPPGIAGYTGAQCGDYDVDEARRLLAEAGYPDGQGLRKIQVLYNTSEAHEDIAVVLQQQWKTQLGIDIELKKLEWGVYLDALSNMEYDVARSGWIGDYPDPNTFLDMFVTDGTNNQTGWSDQEYDRLIQAAQSEPDAQRRMQMLQDTETILMRELPILPVYFYVSLNMVRPYVAGFYPNIQDIHPLQRLSVDKQEKQRILQAEGLR